MPRPFEKDREAPPSPRRCTERAIQDGANLVGENHLVYRWPVVLIHGHQPEHLGKSVNVEREGRFEEPADTHPVWFESPWTRADVLGHFDQTTLAKIRIFRQYCGEVMDPLRGQQGQLIHGLTGRKVFRVGERAVLHSPKGAYAVGKAQGEHLVAEWVEAEGLCPEPRGRTRFNRAGF